MEAHDSEKSRQAAAQIAGWLAAAWNGPAYDALAGVCFCLNKSTRRPRTAMPRRCEYGLRNDEFHEPVEDAGASSRGRCRGRQCPRHDHRPCFSHRVFSARGVTSLRGHQRIHDVMLRQWELTTHQLSVPAPHTKLLSAPKSLTSAHEVMNQL